MDKADPEQTPEYRSFRRMERELKMMMELSIDSFAAKLWAKKIIDDKVYYRVFDSNYEGAAKRTMSLMKYVRTKILEGKKQDPKQEKKIISLFGEVVREVDPVVLANAAEEIEDCDDAEELRDISNDLIEVLETSINSIATALFSKGIIGEVEYDTIIDPAAEHSQRVTNAIFKAISKQIKIAPTETFDTVKGILVNWGEPITPLGTNLEKARFEEKEKQKTRGETKTNTQNGQTESMETN